MECPRCHKALIVRSGKQGRFLGCRGFPDCRFTEALPLAHPEHPWITASEIGEATFCGISLYLKADGQVPHPQHRARMQEGRLSHQAAFKYRRKRRSQTPCYIATYAFGEHHPITEALRDWRDTYLSSFLLGRLAIRLYYGLSPLVIKTLGRHAGFKRLVRWSLMKWVN